MWNTLVSFIPNRGCDLVSPPLVEGRRSETWVKTKGNRLSEIEFAAHRKIGACYGISITDLHIEQQYHSMD